MIGVGDRVPCWCWKSLWLVVIAQPIPLRSDVMDAMARELDWCVCVCVCVRLLTIESCLFEDADAILLADSSRLYAAERVALSELTRWFDDENIVQWNSLAAVPVCETKESTTQISLRSPSPLHSSAGGHTFSDAGELKGPSARRRPAGNCAQLGASSNCRLCAPRVKRHLADQNRAN